MDVWLAYLLPWLKISGPVLVGLGVVGVLAFIFPTLRVHAVLLALVLIFAHSIWGNGFVTGVKTHKAAIRLQLEKAKARASAAERQALEKFERDPDNYSDRYERREQ